MLKRMMYAEKSSDASQTVRLTVRAEREKRAERERLGINTVFEIPTYERRLAPKPRAATVLRRTIH